MSLTSAWYSIVWTTKEIQGHLHTCKKDSTFPSGELPKDRREVPIAGMSVAFIISAVSPGGTGKICFDS